jgi:hypothetical protein
MTAASERIVVTGLIARYPLGGLTWHYLQYVVGLAQLGHQVFYLEDSGGWPYNPVDGGTGLGCEFNVAYLNDVLADFGLEQHWAYCFPDGRQWFGVSDEAREETLHSADLLINVSGVLHRPDAYRQVKRLAYLDTDPVFTQIRLARGDIYLRSLVDAHDVHFSFGEALGDPVPATGHQWIPTRQPVLLAQWDPMTETRDFFTTVMNWTSYSDVEWQGRTYGQKNAEFLRFLDLPTLVAPSQLEVAVALGKTQRAPYDLLRRRGWRVVDPAQACPDLEGYRQYVSSSRAEWAVAKQAYVAGRPGWFSERSACYLAAGRPVVVQDTGFGARLPVGEGIIPFSTMEEAAAGIRAVEASYEHHSTGARQIAAEYFESSKVLQRLLEDAFA